MTMVEQVKRMMMHSAYDTCSGVLVTSFHSHSPDLVPGDLAYLDPNRPHDVQLRPVLDGERPGGNYSGTTWLVWTAPSGRQIRAIVALPAPHRRNVASNVTRAIRRVARVSPAHALAFEMACSGLDPFAELKRS
jgi:hypothetical protein